MDAYWSRENFDDEAIREAEALVDRIRAEVRSSRILLPPAFAAFDTNRSGKLSCSRFRRALTTLQLRAVQNAREAVLQALCFLFAHEEGELDLIVNYREFVRAADASPGSVPPGLSPETVAEMELQYKLRRDARLRGPAGDQESKNGASEAHVDELIADIRQECATKRIRLRDFFAPYDTLRKGKIPTSKFKSALHMGGISCVHGVEVGLVAQRFQLPQDPLQVDYLHFLRNVDATFMKETAVDDLPARKPPAYDAEALETALHPMQQICRIRRLHLDGAFNKFDRHNIKAVTRTQFMSVLKTNGLLPKHGVEDAIHAIHAAFPARHPEKINYLDFLQALYTF